jgi:hypothetical protein
MQNEVQIADNNLMEQERKIFICNLLAQYKTAPEIQSLLKEMHNVDMSRNTIYNIRDKNKQFIEQQRAKYLANLSDVPIAQEKVRLERDEELYLLSLGIENPKDRVSTALSCLKEAREETKKVEYQNNFIQFNQFNTLSDEELLEKKRRIEEKIINIKAEVLKDGQDSNQ